MTPSLTLLVICDNDTVLWRHHCQCISSNALKHGTQNMQNDCHQWLSGSFRVHHIRFRPGLPAPDPAGGAYSTPPDPTQRNIENYRVIWDKTRHVMKTSKRHSWQTYVSKINSSTSIKKVWSMVRKIAGKSSATNIKHLNVNNIPK